MSLNKRKGTSTPGFDLNKNTNTILAYWDKDEVCRFINYAVFNWFGTSPEQLIDKISLREFLGPVYERSSTFVKAAFNGRTQVFNRMISIPSGEVLNARITYVPDIDDNNVKGLFVHVADVSHIGEVDRPNLNDALRKTIPHNQGIENIEQVLKANLLTGFPGISDLAKKNFLSESKLKRKFKDKYGTTIFAYYRHLQMELANKYISSKEYNKSQMALMLNFSNPSNFSSCYKKYLKDRQLNAWLNYSYASYKAFVEHSVAAVAMFDINMHFIATSKKWLHQYDLNSTAITRKSLNEVLPNIEERFRALQLDALKGITNNYVGVAVEGKEGSQRWIRLDIQPWYKSIDEVGGVLIFTEDVTALKQAEEKDRQFFEIFNKTSEVERIGTWYRNFNTNTAAWSKITREILEVSDDYLIPDLETSLNFYKEGESRELVRNALKEALKKRSSLDVEVELVTAKGNLKRVRIICYSEFQNGKCEKISGIFHEIGVD